MHPKPFFSVLTAILIVCLGFAVFPDHEDKLLNIAKEYKSYNQKVSGELIITDTAKYEWTVAMCVTMSEEESGYHIKMDSSFFSRPMAAKSPHGNKLYQLFIKNKSAYDEIQTDQPIGQTLVKETWDVQQVNIDSLTHYLDAVQSENDSNWYRPVSVAELFIMFKEEPSKENDQGWVYGIVDLKNESEPKILSQGNISSCISCHKDTKYDRLFGNPDIDWSYEKGK